ncbi:MAG TPA: hypothetical protein VNV65_03795 [Candidatus Solibacter sp.]|jgi:hypothetical protein|nr:hypothetical protein [Candidatus Solibacter sp.]
MNAPLVSAGTADRPDPGRGARTERRWTYRLFGITVSSAFRLPGLAPIGADERITVTLDLADRAVVEAAFGEPSSLSTRLALGGGQNIDVVLGTGGDRLLTAGREASFYIAPAGERVLCAPADPGAAGWQKILLDTVMGTAALAHGHEGLHAGAVVLDEGVVAIASPSGGGKSVLCAELVARGARLFADDLVFLERGRDGAVRAHAGPPLMTLPAAWSQDRRLGGEVLDIDAGQAWIALRQDDPEPARLLAVLVLDRRAGTAAARVEPGRTPVELHAVALHSVLQPDRRRARFELLADLAQQTAVRRLVADPATPPSELAELVESSARLLARR